MLLVGEPSELPLTIDVFHGGSSQIRTGTDDALDVVPLPSWAIEPVERVAGAGGRNRTDCLPDGGRVLLPSELRPHVLVVGVPGIAPGTTAV